MKKIRGYFDKKADFGFVVTSNGMQKEDFYVASKNTLGATNKDIVEIEVLKTKKGKNKEAKIIKIIQSKNDLEENDFDIIGIYSEKKEGFGYVDIEGTSKGYFVYNKNKNSALDGDKIGAKIKIYKGRKEAEIIKIIERKKRIILGVYESSNKGYGFVISRNNLFKNDIFIKDKNLNGAKGGDLVGVEIKSWDKKNPEGIIVQVLGASNEYSLQEKDILGIILESGVENTFSKNVIKESKYLKKNILINNNIYGRKDLKDIFTFTIDSIDAKDLDDAISIELISNGDYKLYTHIADVSNYVKENSNIDLEAKKRSTSIYLSDRVIPMLPEDLSNDLCSLEPNTDKLTLTVEIIISAKGGNIISTKVYNSIINSNYRITYKDVNDIEKNIKKLGDKLEFNQIISKELIDKLLIASKLKEVILDNRNKNGILDFDFPETYISFDSKGKVNGINEYKRYESNKIIEAFMVITNEAIGKEFSFLPFLYRTHEAPNFEDLINLNEKLNFFGIDFQIKENTTKEFALLLKKIDCLTKGKKLYIQKQVLRTLTEANYSNINIGHFGLGIKFYSHFTSPIRRYPDLQIHRIIKEALNNKILDGGKKELKYSLDKNRLLHYKKILPEIATQSGEKERLAQKLEYKVRDYFIVEYYKKRVGEEFEGFISGMIPKGFFVELDNTAEGFVNIENGLFDEKLFTFISENTKKYTIGDVVKVRLIEVDKKLLRLNFELI